MLRLVLCLSILSSLVLTSSAQTCREYVFPGHKVYSNCSDLPQLSSFLHWNYVPLTGMVDIAFRHTGITTTGRWVAWAINPNNTLNQAMVGAQALVAILPPNGVPRVYTSPISGYATQLAQGDLIYRVTSLTATYQNSEVTIYAIMFLRRGTLSFVHLWQDGPLSGFTPSIHNQASANLNAKEVLNLV